MTARTRLFQIPTSEFSAISEALTGAARTPLARGPYTDLIELLNKGWTITAMVSEGSVLYLSVSNR
jgi:hypothetical protein